MGWFSEKFPVARSGEQLLLAVRQHFKADGIQRLQLPLGGLVFALHSLDAADRGQAL
jgi:hypothetical protein